MSDRIEDWIPGADQRRLSGPQRAGTAPAAARTPESPETAPAATPAPDGSASSIKSSADFGARLDAVDFAEIEDTGEARGLIPAGEIEAAEERAGLIGEDEFWQAFCFAFDAGGAATGLQSLPIGEDEKPAGRAAAGAIYQMIARYPAVARWILGPQAGVFGDVLAIGSFAVPKYLTVRAELQARRIEAATARPRAAVPAGPDGDTPDGARAVPVTELSGEERVLCPT